MNYKWTCPDCKKDRQIEEIITGATVCSRIGAIEADGTMEYPRQENTGGILDRYQCVVCGTHVADPITGDDVTDAERLADLLDITDD